MTDDRRERFLAGERPDDVLVFLAERTLDAPETLAQYGERVPTGVVLVLDGERGRRVFERATGVDPLAFARTAGGRDGEIDLHALEGRCPTVDSDGTDPSGAVRDEISPDGETDATHDPRYVLAFAEERDDDAGGIYAEGDVIHAYALCACNTAYSDRWVVGER